MAWGTQAWGTPWSGSVYEFIGGLPMGEYQSAGIYIEERSTGPGAIAGVSTSTYASVGFTPRGPENEATLLTSLEEYFRIFGDHWKKSDASFAMTAFFNNGGQRAYFVRVTPSDAAQATVDVTSDAMAAKVYGWVSADPIVTLDGTHYNINLDVDNAGAADIDVTGDNGVGGSYALSAIVANINTAVGSDIATVSGSRILLTSTTTGATSEIEFVAPGSNDCTNLLFGLDEGSYPHTYTGAAEETYWTEDAVSKGAYGNNVKSQIIPNPDYLNSTTGAYTKFTLQILETDSDGNDAVEETYEDLSFSDTDDTRYMPNVINVMSPRVDFTVGADGPDVTKSLKPTTWAGLSIGVGDAATTSFVSSLPINTWPDVTREVLPGQIVIKVAGTQVGTDTDSGDGTGTITGATITSGTINYETGAVTVEFTAAPAADDNITADYIEYATGYEEDELAGGADGAANLTRTDMTASALQANNEGMYALDLIDEMMQLSVPDLCTDPNSIGDMIDYAESRKDLFVLGAVPINYTPTQAVSWMRKTLNRNTSYGGIYYPHVNIADPLNESRAYTMPPVGHIAGVIARTDSGRNVGKAPAGIDDGKLNYCIGLERTLTKGERDTVYPVRINPLIDSPYTGRATWGARTMSLNSEWRYIQARRLFMYVEKSVFTATHWIVFENNGPGLWAKIKLQLVGFLTNLFNDGYFAGTTPQESYAVVVDESNNPQSSIDAGFVIVDVYLAPNKPGEFIRFRFQQLTAQAA